MDNKVLANLFGIIGTVLWSVQLIPQIHLNFKRKSTLGVSPTCFGCWYMCGVILGTDLVFNHSAPALVVQISCFSLFCLVIVMQHLFYQKKYTIKRLAFTLGLTILVTCATIISIFSILHAKNVNETAIKYVLTVIATLLMTIGFIPQVLEIYHEMVGLSKIFVIMDFCGGVFSILSLLFQDPFDYYSFSTYVVVPLFQTIIFILIIRIEWKHRHTQSEMNIGIIDNLEPLSPTSSVSSSSPHSFASSSFSNKHEEISIDMEDRLSGGRAGGNNNSILTSNVHDNDCDNDHEYEHLKDKEQLLSTSTLIIKETSIMNNDSGNDSDNDEGHHIKQPLHKEFDHIMPSSVTTNTELLIKQQQMQSHQLAQQQALIDESIAQLRNNLNITIINNNTHHGYPDS